MNEQEENIAEEVEEPKKEPFKWKHNNDIMQNMASKFIGPLGMLKDALVEERNKLVKNRNECRKRNLNG